MSSRPISALVTEINGRSRSTAAAAEQNCAPKICLIFSRADDALRQDFYRELTHQNYCGAYREIVADKELITALNSEHHDPRLSHIEDANLIVMLLSQNLLASCKNAGITLESLVRSRMFRDQSLIAIICDRRAATSISSLREGDCYPRDKRAVWDARQKCNRHLLRTVVGELVARVRFSEKPSKPRVPRKQSVMDAYLKFLAESSKTTPPRVFISYSSRDSKEVLDLITSLKSLVHTNKIQLWSDHRLRTGDDWTEEIERQIAAAHIFILLITQNYTASEAIHKWEIGCIMQRVDKNGRLYPIAARVAPIKVALPWIMAAQLRPREGSIWPGKRSDVEKHLTDITNEIADIAAHYTWYTWQKAS